MTSLKINLDKKSLAHISTQPATNIVISKYKRVRFKYLCVCATDFSSQFNLEVMTDNDLAMSCYARLH